MLQPGAGLHLGEVAGGEHLVGVHQVVEGDGPLDHVDAGENSVGTGISVSHGGATLRGMNVEIAVTVAKVDGRMVTFDLLAKDDIEEISKGVHSRFVVEVDKLRQRVAGKAAKAGVT